MKSRCSRYLIGAALAVVGFAIWPASAAFAAPALNVDPSTNLLDGQQVAVSGTSYTPGVAIGIAECRVGATDINGCDLRTLGTTTTDGSGAFSATYTVRRIITVDTGTLDCAIDGCLVGAANVGDYSEEATAPIAFDASVPPPPPLKFRVDPDRTDAVRPDKGVARITGTVHCNQPVDLGVVVELSQTYKRSIFTSDAFVEIFCEHTTRFAIVFRPVNGLFGAGAAKLHISAYAFDQNVEKDRTVAITLVPHVP